MTPSPPPTAVMTGLGFPEALRWRHGALWFSDMFRSRVIRWDPDGERIDALDASTGCPEIPGGLGWLPDGDLLVVDTLLRRILRVRGEGADAIVSVHAELGDVMSHPANDLHVDADGTAWVGGYGFDPDRDMPHPSTLIRVSPDGDVSVRSAPLVFPNGCERDVSGSLVVAETFADRIRWLDARADRVVAERRFPDGSGPDGLSIARDGTVMVAMAFAGAVVAVDPDGGPDREIYRPKPDATGRSGVYDCAVHPDGRRLAVAIASLDESLAMREDTGRIEVIAMQK